MTVKDPGLALTPDTEQTLTLSVEHSGPRLDSYLADHLSGFSRAQVQQWIKSGRVTVDGVVARASHRMATGEHVEILVPVPETRQLLPEPIPLDVVYEDGDLAVINKRAGMVVHPAHGNWTGTLVNALLQRWPEIAWSSSELRPGIVHRLDKDTSGLLVIAKSEEAQTHLQAQFKDRNVSKTYVDC